MNRTFYQRPPCWYSPQLSPLAIRLWRPLRRSYQRRNQRLASVDVQGLEGVRKLIEAKAGVLITPNHSSHADSVVLYAASDELGIPFYVMAAWQVFHFGGLLKRVIMRHHGCFSVDREGTDLTALRQARSVLEEKPNPLVIFPEGEVYHTNERVTPFRDGPSAIALMAARKADRPIYCVPCAMRYHYVEDPTPELLELMDRLERAVYWRPKRDLPLPSRIYQLAEAMLALKEIEFCARTASGPLPDRIRKLIECILEPIETRCETGGDGKTIPERVKAVRSCAIGKLEELPEDAADRQAWYDVLDDVFLVIQAYSYPDHYVGEAPTIERMAETLDKFEEDLLGRETATVRGQRRVTVRFGEPIEVPKKKNGMSGEQLTNLLEQQVQSLLSDCD